MIQEQTLIQSSFITEDDNTLHFVNFCIWIANLYAHLNCAMCVS